MSQSDRLLAKATFKHSLGLWGAKRKAVAVSLNFHDTCLIARAR